MPPGAENRLAYVIVYPVFADPARTGLCILEYCEAEEVLVKVLRICSWDTPEGVAQAHAVMRAVQDYDPMCVPEFVAIEPAEGRTGKVFDLSALDRALLEGRADLSVQSLERLRHRLPPGLPIVAVGHRGDARSTIAVPSRRGMPNVLAPIGVPTPGQKAQMEGIYPNWSVEIVDGSVMDRLGKLDRDLYGAMLFSAAELIQVRQLDRAYEVFPIRQMLPAAGQGIVAVQGRLGENMAHLSRFHDVDSWDMALCERSFTGVLGERTPSAVHATIRGEKLTVSGMMADKNGRMWTGVLSGRREDAGELGAALAARLRNDAAGPRPYRRREE